MSWSAIDKAFSHSNYDRVTEVFINCNEPEVEALPPGYKCTNDLFAQLLPEQMARGRFQGSCDPEDSDEEWVCAYHRYCIVSTIPVVTGHKGHSAYRNQDMVTGHRIVYRL